MFEKYARAVADKTERENLHRLYRIRNIVFGCFMACCIAIIAESLVFADEMNDGQMICFGLTLLCWILTGVMTIVLFVKFRRKFREILARPQEGGESDDVAAYRRQAVKEQKSTRWALWTLVGCIVAMIVLIAVDTVRYDDEELHGFGYAGIAVAVAGVLVYIIAAVRANLQKTMPGNADNAPDVQKIDAQQGRTPKYRLQEDANLSNFKYIFPTPALREQAENLRKKSGTATMISMVGALAVSIACIFLLFSPWGFWTKGRGYAFPLCLAFTFLAVYFATLPFTLRLRAVEKEQKQVMEQTPAFANNLAVYRAYEQFGKRKGKVLQLFVAASFVASLALAIALPDKLYSLIPAVLIFVGAYINNFFVARLRRQLIPIEREIDAAQREEAAKQEEAAKSEDAVQLEEAVKREEDSISEETAQATVEEKEKDESEDAK